MGTAAIAAAAAASAREQERVLECFRLADATAADRAQPLDRLGLVGNQTVEQWFEAGVVLPGAAPHTVYLSEAAYVTYRRSRQNRAVWAALAAGIVLLAGGLALAVFTSHRPLR
jgi:hypothetical protein